MSRISALVRHDLLRRSAYFSISVIAATAVGIVSIPLLIRTIGTDEWARLFVLQMIGQFASICVAFGWGATGPSTVSALPKADRRQFLLDSLVARVPLLLIVTPLAVALGIALGADPLAAVLATIAYAVPGIGAAWYFIGTNRPAAMLIFDALPAVLGQVAALVAVVFVPTLVSYLWTVAGATTLGVVGGLVYALTRKDGATLRRTRGDELATTMRTQVAGLATVLFGNLATMLPVLLVDIFMKPVLPVFAAVDKLYRYGIIVLAPILQAVQSWVPEAGRAHTRSRALSSLWVGLGVGAIGGTCFALLATPISIPLTLGEAVIPFEVALIAGIGFAAECVAQIVGLAGLVALRRERELARSSIVAACVSIPLMIPALLVAGLLGVVSVIALSALLVATYRTVVLLRAAKEWERASDPVSAATLDETASDAG
ncbi:lipopolysaccharide biosynthesis protein [Microbacterium sp. NPDC087591]|uniref:lipopolysaccharide biosynthesis protein n=1 Tax=Microbacterium sp. NPDC087591 TaxID=3364192 RepID=UPI0037F2E0B3